MKYRHFIFLFALVFSISIISSAIIEEADKKIDIETSIGSIVGVSNENIIGKGVQITKTKGDSRTKIRFLERSSYLKIKYKEKIVEYTEFDKIDFEGTKEPTLFLDKDSKIIEGYMTIRKEGNYVFGNEDIFLKKDTGFIYKDGKAQVILQKDSKIEDFKTTKFDSKLSGIEFSFKIEGNSFVLANGDKFIGELKYKDGNLYFDGDGELNEIKIKNPGKVPTVLDFTGKPLDINGAYISINKNERKIVIGNKGDKDGPGVMFKTDSKNTYGLWIQNTDHFSVKALADSKGSYMIIQDRSNQQLIPKAEVMGNIAINEDNKGVYTKDGKLLTRLEGRYFNDFSEAGTTGVPIELEFFKNNGNKEYIHGKNLKFVISNNLEMGYGPDPNYISGTPYYKSYPLVGRGVSNRLYYNYIEYSKKGFADYTKLLGTPIPLSMDSYAEGKMTPDKYRMLIDIVNGLPVTVRKHLMEDGIRIQSSAGGGAMAWGWDGGLKIAADYLDPGTLRHEMTHAGTLGRGSGWYNSWKSVGGGTTAFTSGYGRTDEDEDVAEYGGEFIYKSGEYTSKYLNGNQGKYYRGKMAVMLKYDIITRAEFNYHFSNAGLPYDDASIDKYIQEAKK